MLRNRTLSHADDCARLRAAAREVGRYVAPWDSASRAAERKAAIVCCGARTGGASSLCP